MNHPHTIPGRRGEELGASPPNPLLTRRLAGAVPAPLRRGAGRRDGSARPPPPSAGGPLAAGRPWSGDLPGRSEEHTSELQSRGHLVCRLLLEKKKKQARTIHLKRKTDIR